MSRALSATQTVRASGALLLANARYWSNVAPLVHRQIAHWEHRAQAIADPLLAAAASNKLREERFNVELAATLATLAPRAHRARTVEAIVALQLAYDYLDTLTEQPIAAQLSANPFVDAKRLYRALLDAVAPNTTEMLDDYYGGLRHSQDGGYLHELVDTARCALAGLPATGAIMEVARRTAKRCAEAQMLQHAAVLGGDVELESWARREAANTGLEWPELLAGASASVLALHALIAAAADPRTTVHDARQIDAVYLSIGALTMLDSLIDHERDASTGESGYERHYDSIEQMALHLGVVARNATCNARDTTHASHHVMTLVGVVAFYASAPSASDGPARQVTQHLRRELQPLITPIIVIMRSWRLTKSINVGLRSKRGHRFKRS